MRYVHTSELYSLINLNINRLNAVSTVLFWYKCTRICNKQKLLFFHHINMREFTFTIICYYFMKNSFYFYGFIKTDLISFYFQFFSIDFLTDFQNMYKDMIFINIYTPLSYHLIWTFSK